MESLLWGLLGFVIFPLWLLIGLLDYWLHQRSDIAVTAGEPESRLHLVQTIEVGIPVLIVLFLELNLLALSLLVAAAFAHTVTAYWDVDYASRRRVILPFEQVVHAFLFTLPLFGTALLVILHWPVAQTPKVGSPGSGDWTLQLRDPPWSTELIVVVLLASFLYGLVPAVVEWRQTRTVARAGLSR
jgi:hypothetical protein